MKRTISILGCGWLGLPLAEFLSSKGHIVKGSTTSIEKISVLRSKNIQPFHLLIDDSENNQVKEQEADFFNCDILVINIPPKVKTAGDYYHPRQIRSILKSVKKHNIKKVIYISATSVYPPDLEVVDEATSISSKNTGNTALFAAEALLQKEPGLNCLILRCGGLLGHNRIPGRYYSGKLINTGDTPVNYIHRDDVIIIISLLIEKEIFGKKYNLVTPKHPSRKEVFSKNAEDFGFEAPVYIEDPGRVDKKKLVLGSSVIADLNYQFKYPDPLCFYYTL